MTTPTLILEGYIKDLSTHAIQQCGSIYTNNVVQVIAEDGVDDFTLEHSFYAINTEGVYRKLGGISFNQDGGELGMSFDLTNSEGVTEPILGLSSAGLEITGGSASFETTSIEVSDIDITLASGAMIPSDIDTGGINLGTVDSGIISILYSTANDHWRTNTGFNVESGKAFTVDTDKVVLDETGLTIDDIVLSQTGLQIGSDVSITSSDITLGTVDPVILNSSGLSVGSDLSLNTSTGLLAGDVSLNSTDGLTIGSGPTALVLDSTGLAVGADLTLDSTGLVVGDESFQLQME